MGLGNEGIDDIGKADLEKDRETENLKAVELLCSMLIAFYGSVICGSLWYKLVNWIQSLIVICILIIPFHK